MLFKDFYFNIEDKYNKEEELKEKIKETKNKTNFTSKTSNNKKIRDDSSIVIHSIKNNKRKSAKFEGIQPNDDDKVVNIIRKGSKTGSTRLNLNKKEKDL